MIEDVNGNPRVGDTLELMNKALRKMKVVENREEPFQNENTTYYVWNTEDNRRRRDKLKPTNYIRSDSPGWLGYLRTASRNKYVRDSSKFRKGSDIRSELPEGEESEMKNVIEKLKNDIKQIEDILKEKDTIDVVEKED